MNSPVQLNVLLRNQRCQDYIRGKALISPRAPSLLAGGALGEPCGQVPTICPGSSAAQSAWARGEWQSKSLEVTLKTLSPCTRVPGAQAVGLMCRVTRTNGCQTCAMSPTQQLATCKCHVPMTLAERKGSSPACGDPRPKTKHTARPCFSRVTPSTSDVRGRTGVFM